MPRKQSHPENFLRVGVLTVTGFSIFFYSSMYLTESCMNLPQGGSVLVFLNGNLEPLVIFQRRVWTRVPPSLDPPMAVQSKMFNPIYHKIIWHWARYHTFVEIDHEIISTVILLPSAGPVPYFRGD